ncbi:hypothetical protein [Brasilonema sp. UFV-L1]|uniref:hypothetical protein n=1 Tax=Brasilonema sp. UFV-L1 TaxID=2234130 RepID=UPI00145CCD4D|nr:hypothetical protein [Brasilonema sp. UFV-L1]NMG09815.1 hypothetical protein [Brasilonema sp. UFV-L1]
MQKKRQQRQVEQQVACTDEKLLAAFEEIKFLREQVEFFRELVESQNVHLQYKQQQLEEVEQELDATNKDLCIALMPEASYPFRGNLLLAGLAHLTLFEAKELAQTILKSEKSAHKSVAKLLTIIYGEEVKPEELHKTDMLSFQTNPLKNNLAHQIVASSKEVKTHSKQLRARYKELGCHFVAFKTHCTQIREHLTEFKKRTKETNLGFVNHLKNK